MLQQDCRTDVVCGAKMLRFKAAQPRRRCGALLLLLLMVLQGVVLDAKGKKSGGGGKSGSGKATVKGGDLKAKLAANEGTAALEKRDLQTAISKFLVATEADPGTPCIYACEQRAA